MGLAIGEQLLKCAVASRLSRIEMWRANCECEQTYSIQEVKHEVQEGGRGPQ